MEPAGGQGSAQSPSVKVEETKVEEIKTVEQDEPSDADDRDEKE